MAVTPLRSSCNTVPFYTSSICWSSKGEELFSLSLSSMKVSENSHCIIVVEVISIHLDFLFLKYVLPGRISSIVNCYSDQNRDAIVDLLSLVVLL